MDDLTESIGKLSTNAKEWRPGQAYVPTSTAATTTTTSSLSSTYTPQEYVPNTTTSTTTNTHDSSTSFPSTEQSDLKWTSKEFVPQWSQQSSQATQPQSQPAQTQDFKSQASATTTSSSAYTGTSYYPPPQQDHDPNNDPNETNHLQSVQPISSMTSDTHTHPPDTHTDPNLNLNLTNTSIPAQSQPPPGSSTFTSNNNTQQANHMTHHPITPPPRRTLRSSMGLPHQILWLLYRNMAHESAQELEPNDSRYKAIPPSFTNAMPLDPMEYMNITSSNKVMNVAVAGHSSKKHAGVDATTSLKRSSFGYPTTVFKVMSREDGWLYCLRRLDSVKCVNQKIAGVVLDKWTHATTKASISIPGASSSSRGKHVLEHPGLVRLYQCFYIPQNRAVFFVHHYYPMACTLRDYVHNVMGRNNTHVPPMDPRSAFAPLEESTIWSYVTQLVSAVRAVHQGNLACRTLQLNHILVTPEVGSGADPSMMMHLSNATTQWMYAIRTNRVRLRINCIGVPDALEFEARKEVSMLQHQDMTCLGRIMMSLASGMEIMEETDLDAVGRCEAYIRQHYSPMFCNLTMALMVNHGRSGRLGGMVPPSIEEVSREITQFVWEEMDCAHSLCDNLDEVLASEFESSRALRLLLKMGFINERPEFMVDTRWSETGRNYALKLFRDYVFHQCDEAGRPIMDLGHVVTALNKLDAAEDEKIVLASRDGKSVMVVTFAEIAQALEKAYEELCSSSVTPSSLYHMGPRY